MLITPLSFPEISTLNADPETLGDAENWSAFVNVEGYVCQLIKDNIGYRIWSSNSTLLQNYFPEFEAFASKLKPGTIITGQIVILGEQGIPSRDGISKRIGKKRVTQKLMSDYPAIFLGEDLHIFQTNEFEKLNFKRRFDTLQEMIKDIASPAFLLPRIIPFSTWVELRLSRLKLRQTQGPHIVLLNNDHSSPRSLAKMKKLWKAEPHNISAVLLYAEREGRAWSGPYSTFSLGVQKGGAYVSLGKAKAMLSADQLAILDKWIRANTLERFGPVRVVKPALVFNLQFDDLQESIRHKSGLTLKNPIVTEWLNEASIENISSLTDLTKLIEQKRISNPPKE